jgi:hypothetical protein
MENKLKNLAFEWMTEAPEKAQSASDYYCQTRDAFEARNNRIPDDLIRNGMGEDLAYLIYSMLGELGNNSFDHNLANWPNIPGVFFAVEYDGKTGIAIIADRGLGVLNTLRKAAPDLETDEEALELAFTKKISSRVFENRGNGLKFVKNNITANNLLLEFSSGYAQVIINHAMRKNKLENKIDGCLVILNF